MELSPPLLCRKRSAADRAKASNASGIAEGKDSDKMTVLPLGGGQEVGRSCIVVKYRGCTVMLDCGLHTQVQLVTQGGEACSEPVDSGPNTP